VDQTLVGKLTDFVKNGGTLILTYRSGVKDEHNVVTNQTLPGPLAELAGIEIHDFDPHTNQQQEVAGPDGVGRPARVWFDILTPTTAMPVLSYSKGYYAGKTAMSANRFGQGRVYYVGTELTAEACLEGAKREARGLGIPLGPELPQGVEYAARVKDGKRILFLLNYTEKPQSVSLGEAWRNALTGEPEPAEVNIPAFDVRVLVNP
jgi:beta-galactosidase